MIKRNKHKSEQFMFAVLAVIFAAVAVIMVKDYSEKSGLVQTTSRQQVLGAETPNDLMNQLQTTKDDGGAAEFNQLQNEANGL